MNPAEETPASDEALLVVGHGAEDLAAQAQFETLVTKIAERWPFGVTTHAYLEMATPSIAVALEQLIETASPCVTVTPLLLFAAGHAKVDIPAAVRAVLATQPHARIRWGAPLQRHPKLLEVAAERFQQAEPALSVADLPQTALLVVGRGSKDSEAIEEFQRFARQRWEHERCAVMRAAFLAMAEPGLGSALKAVAQEGWKRVVVQPHLLFEGTLLNRVRESVKTARARWPEIAWSMAPPLGPDDRLATAVVDICARICAVEGARRVNEW